MADTPVPYGPHPVPLETAVVSCWRFGGPSRRHAALRPMRDMHCDARGGAGATSGAAA